MSIIDEQGRVFGRFNLVDAAAALLVVVMAPVMYAAYLLVRDPVPTLTEVAPKVMSKAPNLQVEIFGRSMRPYMRVSFGTFQGRGFYFRSPTQAIVQLPDLPPGKYDVVLYDYAQEVSRLKDALTIDAPPEPPVVTVNVGGVFTGLTVAQVSKLAAGHRFPEVGTPAATILDVGAAQESEAGIRAGDALLKIPQPDLSGLPATLSLVCSLVPGSDGLPHCAVGGVQLAPDVNIHLPGLDTSLNFRVTDIHVPGQSSAAVARVHFTPRAGVREQVAAGDRDIGAKAYANGAMATLQSVTASATGLDAVLRLQLEETPTGWMYKGHPVKAGAGITFDTEHYTMDGTVTGLDLPKRHK